MRRPTILPDEKYRKYIERCSKEAVIRLVHRYYSADYYKINTRNRSRKILMPIQVAMYFLTVDPQKSYKAIGLEFGKDHATVLHSRNQVESIMSYNKQFHLDIEKICVRLMNHATRVKRIQILGAITGVGYEYAKLQFMTAESDLINNGFEVINPIRIVPRDSTWREAMNICLTSLINEADGYYRLKNWSESRGAKIEFAVASGLGIKEVMVINGDLTLQGGSDSPLDRGTNHGTGAIESTVVNDGLKPDIKQGVLTS